MKLHWLLPIRTTKCHCGNTTEAGGREKPPTDKSKKLCCILCRCGEHLGNEYRPTDTLPGCGAKCIYHSVAVRKQRVEELQQRAFAFNYRKG